MAGKVKNSLAYRDRSGYRRLATPAGLRESRVRVRETDLQIFAVTDVTAMARHIVLEERRRLEAYIRRRPEFLTSLVPLADDPTAPSLARTMLVAGRRAGVGPMAAVAGGLAQRVGERLLAAGCTDEVVVENGGDIFLARHTPATLALFAGTSPLSRRLAIRVAPAMMPVGVCTSSAAVGHSLSRGRADAATVLAGDTALADAAATALGNRVRTATDIQPALEEIGTISGVRGAVVVLGEHLGAWGAVELVPLARGLDRKGAVR